MLRVSQGLSNVFWWGCQAFNKVSTIRCIKGSSFLRTPYQDSRWNGLLWLRASGEGREEAFRV